MKIPQLSIEPTMLSWLFKPQEVRTLELALRDFEVVLAEKSGSSIGPTLGLSIVKPALLSGFRTSVATIRKRIIDEGMSPTQLLYVAILTSAERELLSGRYHSYRGILSLNGTALLSLWNICLDELVRLKATTSKQAEETRQWLARELAGVG